MAQTNQPEFIQSGNAGIPALTEKSSGSSPYSDHESKDYLGGSLSSPLKSSNGDQAIILPAHDSKDPPARTPRSRKSSSYQTFVPARPGFFDRLLNPYRLTPLLVLVVHAFLLAFTWSFFAVTFDHPVALNSFLAVQIREQFQSVIMVVTLFASFVALVSTVLYTKAVRWSVARFLANHTTLYTLSASMRIANQSPILNFKRPTWTIFAVLCILAVNTQTASYTTLLAPKTIFLESSIEGYELDLRSPSFQEQMRSIVLDEESDVFSRVVLSAEDSGFAAISTIFGMPAVVNFNQFTYFNTTAGIMPVALKEVSSRVGKVSGSTIPLVLNSSGVPTAPEEFPLHFKTTQQGFTVSVACQQRTLDATTSPSLQRRSVTQEMFGSSITLAQLEVGCPGSTGTNLTVPVVTSPNNDSVLAVSCPNNTGSVKSWDLIISGFGKYQPMSTSICSIFPETNILDVDYSDSSKQFDSTMPNFINATRAWDRRDAPWLGDFAVTFFLGGLRVQQSANRNSMGDAILSFYDAAYSPPEVLQDITANYVRGVMETSITALRTVLTEANNTVFDNGSIPLDMRSRINGTVWAETIGWHQSSQTAVAVLLAPTFISLTSLLIILVTLFLRRGKPEPESNNFFDPGDLLQVVAAASAGGISVKFPPFHQSTADYSEDIAIGLGPVNGPNTQPGFISYEV